MIFDYFMNTEKHRTVVELLERICFQRLVDIGLQLGDSEIFPAKEEPAPLSLEDVKEITRCCGRDGLSGRITICLPEAGWNRYRPYSPSGWQGLLHK